MEQKRNPDWPLRASHTRPHARRAREVGAPHLQPSPGALPALSVFLLTWEPRGCSPKDSAAGAAAAAAAAGRVDLRKTGGTPCVRSRRQPARSPGTFPLRQNFGSREVGGEGRSGRAGRGREEGGGRRGSALGAGGWGPGWGVVGQPVPGCVCNQHLSAHRQRRRRGAGSRGAGWSSPRKTTTEPSRRRRLVAARGAPNFIAAKVRGAQPGLGCRGVLGLHFISPFCCTSFSSRDQVPS
ncbi:uncharacterized protein LOC128567434 [Nycticebus coucang]|uniref:uncharacterized protein LOC128567434 n=1 Tax=Nycticebus coucang TaxID=9470 RepID=UPI00234D4D31|nr:uncharacterized protein LOC128567434 [Nycticebus coucang]